MSRIIAAVAISLIAGFAAGAWLMADNVPGEAATRLDITGEDPASEVPLEERLVRLERTIAEERDARLILEDLLRALMDDIERIDSVGPRVFADQTARAEEARAQRRTEDRGQRDFASMLQNFRERQLNGLIEGGFSADKARHILKLESEAQYKALQAAHDAERRGEAIDTLSGAAGSQAILRAELGDSDYERYLRAQGQPTAVQITQVMDSSPGSLAGLQPGDQIVSYNGARIFNMSELHELTLQGSVGENVIVEIERDGMRMQLSVPRGPVGITGTGANLRRARWGGG
jgi:C-terminal processing protease CtpA/Prc